MVLLFSMKCAQWLPCVLDAIRRSTNIRTSSLVGFVTRRRRLPFPGAPEDLRRLRRARHSRHAGTCDTWHVSERERETTSGIDKYPVWKVHAARIWEEQGSCCCRCTEKTFGLECSFHRPSPLSRSQLLARRETRRNVASVCTLGNKPRLKVSKQTPAQRSGHDKPFDELPAFHFCIVNIAIDRCTYHHWTPPSRRQNTFFSSEAIDHAVLPVVLPSSQLTRASVPISVDSDHRTAVFRAVRTALPARCRHGVDSSYLH